MYCFSSYKFRCEQLLKCVMHLRMKTLKMVQQTVIVFDPQLKERLAACKKYQDQKVDLKPEVKEDQDNKIMSFKEIKDRLEDFNNEI